VISLVDKIKTDILVVGSGPAGSVTARYAAMKGAQVTFIERRLEVGVPVRCGEMIPSNEEIKGMFPNLEDAESLFDIPKELHLRDIKGIKLIDPKDKCTLLDFTGYTINRDKFDQYLADEAQKEGADLIKSCQFKEIKDGKAVTTCGDIEYKVIIGADGPGSRVAQSLGLMRNHMPYPAVTAQAKGDFEPYVQMFFGGIAPGAYSWVIPKIGQANIGVGFSPKFSNGTLSHYFDKFVKMHEFDVISDKLEGKYVPSEGAIPKTVAGNGMVVGDAAGHVISVNGGGIPLALIAGRFCGQVAGDNIKEGRSLIDYETLWKEVLYKPLKIAANNKRLADTFAFGSDKRTEICMSILGMRRMGKLIRCKHLFP